MSHLPFFNLLSAYNGFTIRKKILSNKQPGMDCKKQLKLIKTHTHLTYLVVNEGAVRPTIFLELPAVSPHRTRTKQ